MTPTVWGGSAPTQKKAKTLFRNGAGVKRKRGYRASLTCEMKGGLTGSLFSLRCFLQGRRCLSGAWVAGPLEEGPPEVREGEAAPQRGGG